MSKIIFIQGIFNWDSKTEKIRTLLHNDGYEVIYFPCNYSPWNIKKHISLKNSVDTYLQSLPQNETIIILAHSFGGIIAHSISPLYYNKVETLITVGTPHTVPFTWFKKIYLNIGYTRNVPIKNKYSFGLYLDLIVPFIYTNPGNTVHKNIFSLHNQILYSKKLLKFILKNSNL